MNTVLDREDKRNTRNNDRKKSKGTNYTFNIVLRFEFVVKVYAKVDDKIRRLFNQTYDLIRKGAPQQRIASVLKQIMDIAKRYGCFKDSDDEKEKKDPG